jgi:hypothetical protein
MSVRRVQGAGIRGWYIRAGPRPKNLVTEVSRVFFAGVYMGDKDAGVTGYYFRPSLSLAMKSPRDRVRGALEGPGLLRALPEILLLTIEDDARLQVER